MKGKKWKREGKTFSQLNKKNKLIKKKKEDAEVNPTNVIDQGFLPIVDSAGVSTSAAFPAPQASLGRAASQDKEKDEKTFKDLCGFIFLCSRETKLDCFRFRVFGLRSNKKEIVEKIKPGTKLFLFDVELKLLYGVYEATSTGKVDLELHAFGGKFPAQVQFQIFKECLPLRESSFRHAIKDNYHGRKFEPELNGHQVRNLLSLFCPLTASATTTTVSHPLAPSLANVGMPKVMPVLDVEDEIKLLPDPQEVGPSMANVGPLNTNPAFAKEHQAESDGEDVISGFIFLCGRDTKHDCYRFRVFGLPSNKKERVQKIKPGTKLFLFDVELKLLYGIYEATSTGIIDLEPLAFGGKFPAQVKFRIFKECLPLPEASFRYTIKDNYHGVKLEPELNDRQVRDLSSLFHPLAASKTAVAACHPPEKVGQSSANVPPPNIIPSLYMEHHVTYCSMPTSAEDSYMTRMQHVHPPPTVESQRVYELQSAQHGWLKTRDFMESALTVAEHKQLATPSRAHCRLPYINQGTSTDIRNPYLRSQMQVGVPLQPYLMEINNRNYQLYSGVEQGIPPPQESTVTYNYYSGPSAPYNYFPPVQQQYASEAIMRERTSSISYEYSFVRRLG
ncbi:unnamed protein product [Withania somnifera]